MPFFIIFRSCDIFDLVLVFTQHCTKIIKITFECIFRNYTDFCFQDENDFTSIRSKKYGFESIVEV